jgi:hypothetical protein
MTASTPQLGPVALIRFLSELALLAALAFVGAQLGGNVAASIVFAIALPGAAAVTWGQFIGPRASHRLPDPYRFGLEILLFGAASLGLIAVDQWVPTVVLVGLYAVGTSHGRAGG